MIDIDLAIEAAEELSHKWTVWMFHMLVWSLGWRPAVADSDLGGKEGQKGIAQTSEGMAVFLLDMGNLHGVLPRCLQTEVDVGMGGRRMDLSSQSFLLVHWYKEKEGEGYGIHGRVLMLGGAGRDVLGYNWEDVEVVEGLVARREYYVRMEFLGVEGEVAYRLSKFQVQVQSLDVWILVVRFPSFVFKLGLSGHNSRGHGRRSSATAADRLPKTQVQ